MRPTTVLALALAAGALSGIAHAQPRGGCGAFESVPTPGQGAEGSVLTGVAAAGDAGFAVGRFYPEGFGAFTPLLYRYTGSAWVSQGLPSLPGQATSPVLMSAGMSPATGSDAWVVGYVSVPPTINNLPLVMRWSGGSWTDVQTPALRPMTEYPYGPRGGFGHDVAVLSESDVWVVGVANGFGDAQASSIAMALHHDGSGWTDTVVPIVGSRRNQFEAVSASAPDNVWAVGFWANVGSAWFGLVYRWDGDSWTLVNSPGMTIPQAQYHEVLALSPTEVWIAGAINYTTPLLHRWNGSSWQNMPLPGNSAVINLVGTGPTDIFASTSGTVTSIFHWDGASWTEVANPPPPAGRVDSVRGLALAGACDVWAVGSQMSAAGFHGTFAEHLAGGGSACRADWDGDDVVTSNDISAYLVAWLASVQQGTLAADFNNDSTVNSNDISAFLAAWLDAMQGGC